MSTHSSKTSKEMPLLLTDNKKQNTINNTKNTEHNKKKPSIH